MNVNRINIVLAVLLFIVICLVASNDVDRSQPNYEFLPNMKRSAASNAFSANSVFHDGRTMQASVVGTIARGDLPLHYAATKEDAVRAGAELLNPFAPASGAASALRYNDRAEEQPLNPSPVNAASDTAVAANVPVTVDTPVPVAQLQASVQRGAQIYAVYCISCHGATGAGDGPVAKRGFPPPPPLPTGKSVQMQDGQLFHILTYGQGSMSSMAAQLSRDRRWDVINFVRSLQLGAASPAAPKPDATPVPAGLTVPENAAPDVPEKQP